MPTTDEDDENIDMHEDKTLSVLDSCCAVRPGVLRPRGTPAKEGNQCNSVNISPGGVRPTRIMADCSNEVAKSSKGLVSDEKLPSSDPKILSGLSVSVPAVPRLTHNGHIHDEAFELYEDSIVGPNDSEPDCGLVDSSDSEGDMVPGPGRHCALANAMSDDYDHVLADDDNPNIIIPYDSDSDYSPCDDVEGLVFEQPADRQPATKTRRRWRKRSNVLRSRSPTEHPNSNGDKPFEVASHHCAGWLEKVKQMDDDQRSRLAAMMPRARMAYDAFHRIVRGRCSEQLVLRSSAGLEGWA